MSELQKISPEGIPAYLRTQANTLYSSLSKGIHQEFVIPLSVKYDNLTVKDLLKKTIGLITKFTVPDDFDAPLPENIIQEFEGQ